MRAREGEEAALQRLEVYQGEIDGLKGSVSGLDAKLDAVVDAMKTGGLAAPVDRGGEQEAAELRLGMVELKKVRVPTQKATDRAAISCGSLSLSLAPSPPPPPRSLHLPPAPRRSPV